jgi:mono/diheme cytochrome c family protein/glucose/arabinose dehydrogenase
MGSIYIPRHVDSSELVTFSRPAAAAVGSMGRLMFLRRCSCGVAVLLVAGLLSSLPVTTSGQPAGPLTSPGGRPWPTPVQKVPEDSPALSPEAALQTFYMPPGYRLELVASEPMIQDPIWIDIDPDGRLWVVEMRGFMPNAAGDNERAPVGRISVLEDEDDDGRMDKSTVFMDGLVLPRSVKVLDKGVLIAEPPNLWLARDTNGDLKADTKEAVSKDYGRAEGNPEHNANGLMWGLDNWIHTSEHDALLRLKRGQFEQHPTLLRGQWGVTMDDVGRVFRNWNEGALFVDLFPARYLARNPNLVRTRGAYEPLMKPEDQAVWPIRPTRGVNRGYREGTLRADGTLSSYVAAGTPVVYRGDRLPGDLRGNVFITEPAGNLVHRLVVTDDGAGGLTARNAYPKAEFLASTDERFRPVNLLSAADGTLYVVDMYRGIIQHRAYQSDYLQSHIAAHKLDQPIGYGRIYRVTHESRRRDVKPSLSSVGSAALVELLDHPNGWWRDTAQRLLVERGDAAVAPALKTRAAARETTERTRLHALWTLDGLDALDVETVTQALADGSPHVRAAAVRMAERWLREGQDVRAAVLKLADAAAPAVRRQVALSLGELPDDAREVREQALVDLLVKHRDDPVLVDAVISSLKGREAAALERLLSQTATTAAPAPTPAQAPGSSGADAVVMLAGAVMSAGSAEAMAPFVKAAPGAAARPAWQREAIKRGMDLAAPPSLADAGAGKPLTAEEQQRFAAGQQVFQNLCIACHGANGRGQPGLGPSLAGSKWVTGRAGLTARIILNGKEGEKMMPPLQMLTDDQVASVLTFVRRSWGHKSSAVSPVLVREVRGASTGRTRPWTEAELSKLTQPDGPPPRVINEAQRDRLRRQGRQP